MTAEVIHDKNDPKTWPALLYHKMDYRWEYLVTYAVHGTGFKNWAGTEFPNEKGWSIRKNAACFAALHNGAAIALQVMIPKTLAGKEWKHNSRMGRYKTYWSRSAYRHAAYAYLRFICDPEESPWRPVLKDIRIIEDHGKPTGILILDTMVNRALLHNFCIAVRMAWEQTQIIEYWQELKDAGCSNTEALYYATITSLTPQGDKVNNHRYTWHTWIPYCHSYSPMLLYYEDVTKNMDVLDPSLFGGPPAKYVSYPSSNKVWGWHGTPKGLTNLQEFGSDLKKESGGDYAPAFFLIPKSVFLANVVEAAQRRRVLEQEWLDRRKKTKKPIRY